MTLPAILLALLGPSVTVAAVALARWVAIRPHSAAPRQDAGADHPDTQDDFVLAMQRWKAMRADAGLDQ